MNTPQKIQNLLKEAAIPPHLLSQINTEVEKLFQELEEKEILLKKRKNDISQDSSSVNLSNVDIPNVQPSCFSSNEHSHFLQEIINNSPSSVAFVDKNYCYKFISKQYTLYLGIDIEDLKGKHIQNVIGEKAFYETGKTVMDRVFAGETMISETEIEGKQKKGFYVRITSKPAYNKQKEIIGAYIFGEHITELKQKEMELAKSEKHIRNLFNSIHEPIIELDLQGYAKNHNKAAKKFFGIQPDKPLFIPALVHPDDYEKVKEAFKLLKKQGYYENQMYRIIVPSGKLLHVEVSSVAVYDKQGNLSGSIDTVRDITARAKMEQALKRSKERYKILVESSPSGISLNSLTGKRLYASKKSAEIFGYDSPKEMLKRTTIDDIHPNDLENVYQDLKKLVELNGKTLTRTYRGIRKDGSMFYSEANGRIIEENGEKRILLIYNDVTPKVEMEQALAEKNKQLQKYIEYSLQLENFAHLASHDLREPLLNIQSMSHLIETEESHQLSDAGRTYLKYIHKSSQHMERLINELLDYSTIGKYSKATQIDCNILLNKVLTNLSLPIQKSKAQINSLQLPTLIGYSNELKSLFQNLISNALKYCRKNIPPIIQIQAEEKEQHWQFAIKDNGIGVAQKNHEKIFIIYKRLHSLNGEEEKSTGIGLAYCKKVVELHQGKIWVESELNKGSIFYFTIHKNFMKGLHTNPNSRNKNLKCS